MDQRRWRLIAVIAASALAFSACSGVSATPMGTPSISAPRTAPPTKRSAGFPASTATPTEEPTASSALPTPTDWLAAFPTPSAGCDLTILFKTMRMDPTGQPGVYEVIISVRNRGRDPCPPGAQLLDPLPPGVSLSSPPTFEELVTGPYHPERWSCSGTSCTARDSLWSDYRVHFRFKVTVQQRPVTNCARVLHPADTNESNNEKCATVP